MGFFDFLKKESRTTRAVVGLTMGQPQWSPARYDNFAREAYARNPWVYACIQEISRAIAGVPWVLYQGPATGRRGKVREIDVHPLLTLLARPNPEQGGPSFFEAVASYWLISGNCYIEAVGPKGAPPRELYALRPDRMKVIPDMMNRVGGYEYSAGTESVTFTTAEVLHIKTFHPLSDWYGLSPIEAAAKIIDLDNELSNFEVALLQNSARPSGALFTEQQLDDRQFQRLKDQIGEIYAGTRNAGKPMVLDGGLDWKQMALSPEAMSMTEMSKWTAAKIAAAFGVPGEIIGLGAATYQNRREARRALYSETVLPMLDRLRDDLNNWLVPKFGERLRLDYDRDSIEALTEDRKSLYETVRTADWLTVNEKREATGYGEMPEGDVIVTPSNMLPLQLTPQGQVQQGGDVQPQVETDGTREL